MTTWLPIETCPKDGNVFEAWGGEDTARDKAERWEIVFYEEQVPDGSGVWTADRKLFFGGEEWCFGTQDGPYLHKDAFSHWRPLSRPDGSVYEGHAAYALEVARRAEVGPREVERSETRLPKSSSKGIEVEP